jgi:uncharacterized protein YdhG (YjbR/CyaY superfamily)
MEHTMAKSMKTTSVKTVDQYLDTVPEEARITLEKLRASIRSAAPKAEEVISYGIPTYKLNGSLIGFGAASKHCGLYVMSYAVMDEFKNDLQGYDTATSTIRFPFDKPLPATLVKKIVHARIKENDALKTEKGKNKVTAVNNAEDKGVSDFMNKLKHPFKAEVEAVRSIIKKANKNIAERIKWKAPSYYYKEDIVTFNLREEKQVHLVFHHPAIVKIKSRLLEGNYDKRRMTYFKTMAGIKANKKELGRIINELVKAIEK